MRISIIISLVLFSCLAFAPSTKAQLVWDVTRPDTSGYGQCILSCFGNTCTACAQREDYLDVFHVIFWRSDDAGRTWKEQDPNIQFPPTISQNQPIGGYPIRKIDQIDSLHTIVVGDSGLIITTFNGGETWQREQCPVTSDLFDVSCFSFSEGIIVGYNPWVILINTEGGWRVIPFLPNLLTGSDPSYGNELFCHSYGGDKFRVFCNLNWNSNPSDTTQVTLYTTQNGWGSIDSSYVPIWSHDYYYSGTGGCAFLGSDTLIAFGDRKLVEFTAPYRLISRSFDGGKNWQTFTDTETTWYDDYWNNTLIFQDSILSVVYDSTNDVITPRWFRVSNDFGATWHLDTFEFKPNIGLATITPNINGLASITGQSFGITAAGSIIASFVPQHNGLAAQHGFIARMNMASAFAWVTSVGQPNNETTVYPNPATNLLNVENFGGNISILDPLGRSYEVHRNANTLDISSLPSGVYFVSDGRSRAKFVKE